MLSMTERTLQEIKVRARLFDLQGHVCDGRLTIHPDGRRTPGDRNCAGCDEILELHYELDRLQGEKPGQLDRGGL